MTDLAAADARSQPSLAERLQHVTEMLAGTRSQAEIFQLILHPALRALGGVAGAVLLVGGAGDRLVLTATEGHEQTEGHRENAPLIWQDGPLDAGLPAADALARHQPLYFEHLGALVRAYPDLEQHGSALPVATAVLPMFLDGRPLGTLIFDFREPHEFSVEERRFLQTLASQCAVALGRVQVLDAMQLQLAEQQRRADALSAFIAFTEAADTTTDTTVLVAQAQQVLRLTIPNLLGAYYELRNGRWRAQITSTEVPEEIRVAARLGVSPRTPAFARAAGEGKTLFVEEWNAAEQGLPLTAAYNRAALSPHLRNGQAVAMFTVGFASSEPWTAAQREIVQAVAQGLKSSMERAERLQLQERQVALEAFVTLTEAVGSEHDQQRLAERARDLLLMFLPGWSVGFYRLRDQLWKASLTEVSNPELGALLHAGLPIDTPRFAEAVRTEAPVFVNDWDAAEQRIEYSESYGTAGFYPYFSQGRPTSMLVVGSETFRTWAAADQTTFLAVGRSLGLALNWAAQAEELQVQNAALEAFTHFTEATADTNDPGELVDWATKVLASTLGEVSVAHYDLEEGFWQLKAWSSDITPNFLRLMQAGFSQDTPRFANAVRHGQATFVRAWDASSEGMPAQPHYGAIASYPYFAGGRPVSLLSVGVRGQIEWNEREQSIVRAVGRSLGLALERAAAALDIIRQRDALDLRTQELEAANTELEAFTYSASHDLRTPVRHVMGFAELTQKALAKNQVDKAGEYLEVIQQAAGRMTALIDGMLVLSRAGRQEFAPRMFDLEGVVAQARRDAGLEFPGRPVRWQVGSMPPVWGDPGMIQQVMTNLLSNAVKYSATRTVSEIRVSVRTTPTEWVIEVHDNGVGFDPQYTGRLFGIFQRLHTQKVFQGTGVGLATVRRIVLRHGGRVFAESPDDTGATFGFTLPRVTASTSP